MAKEKFPAVTEDSMGVYKDLRNNAYSVLKHGVLPNIYKAIQAQLRLEDVLLNDSDNLFDQGDRELLASYHLKSLPAGVKQSLNRIQNKMQAVLDEAIATDLALVAAGEKQFFDVILPEVK